MRSAKGRKIKERFQSNKAPSRCSPFHKTNWKEGKEKDSRHSSRRKGDRKKSSRKYRRKYWQVRMRNCVQVWMEVTGIRNTLWILTHSNQATCRWVVTFSQEIHTRTTERNRHLFPNRTITITVLHRTILTTWSKIMAITRVNKKTLRSKHKRRKAFMGKNKK